MINLTIKQWSMNSLKLKFKKNGLPYHLVQRNEVVALYGVGGTFTEKVLHYEVCCIKIRNDQYGIREALPSNEEFGRDESRAIMKYEEALDYFHELTSATRIDVGALNDVKSGMDNSEVDPEATEEGLSPPI